MTRWWLIWPTLVILAGPRLAAAGARIGGSVAVDEASGAVWVAQRDVPELIAYDEGAKRRIAQLRLPGAAEQVVVAADGSVFATVPALGMVVRARPDASAPAVHAVVGNVPYGLALSADGAVLLATLAGDAEVVALDPVTLGELQRISVDPDPRGISITADDHEAIVAHVTGEVLTAIALPRAGRDPALAFGQRSLPLASNGARANLAVAMAIDPSGRRIYVPHELADEGARIGITERQGTYGGGTQLPRSFGLSMVDLDGTVELDEEVSPLSLASMISLNSGDPRCAQVSQPSAAAFDARARLLFIAGLGSDAVTALDAAVEPGGQRYCVRLPAGSGARGLALSPSGRWLYVDLSFRHALGVVRLPDARHEPVAVSAREVRLGVEPLPPAVTRGRALFYRAGNRAQSKNGTLPCGACHPGGLHDGLVWRISGGPRQTPVLAGRLVGTGPYNWLGTQRTLRGNIGETVRRLGGHGLPKNALADLEAFVTRGLTLPPRIFRDTSQIARGRVLFRDAALGCAHCHDPARRFADGQVHDVGSHSDEDDAAFVRFKTPSLLGVARSAPYLHDGGAASLRELLVGWNDDDRMGRTSHLSPPDLDALIAYLETL
jgi:DNA-binding beta-propeller fold protein YncE